MRVGLIGVGRMGVVHGRLLGAHPAVTTLYVHDSDRPRLHEVAAELGASPVPDLDDLLGVVDAVVIAATTAAHAALIERAVDAGAVTFCEKPIAPDLAATDRVMQVIAARGGRVQMGFQRRFDPGYVAARELVASGRLGEVYLVTANSFDHRPPPPEYVASSGGMYRDLQVHDFDLVRFVTGQEVVSAYAAGAVLIADSFSLHDDVDTSAAILHLSAGTLAVATATRHSPHGHDVRMQIAGRLDNVMVGLDERTPLRTTGGGAFPRAPYRDFLDRFAEAYRLELDAFVRFAKDEIPNPCTPEDAREALRVAEACDRSRRLARPVALEEIR